MSAVQSQLDLLRNFVVSSAHEKAHELTENMKKTRMKVRHKTKEC